MDAPVRPSPQPRIDAAWPEVQDSGPRAQGLVSRRVPYLGTMYADRQIPLAAQCGNMVLITPQALWTHGPHGEPAAEAIRRFAHLHVVLCLPVWPQVYYDPEWWPHWIAHLEDVRARLEAAPWLREKVRAIFVDEEVSLGARGTRFDHVPGVLTLKTPGRDGTRPYLPILLDLVCAAQTRVINAVRERFPGVLLGTTEPQWVLDRTHPYYTPLPAIDVLGIDAYVPPPITEDGFKAIVVPTYAYAQTIGLPILMIAQAFTDSAGMWRGPMITADQMRWYGELAEQTPHVAGLAWFLLEHPTVYDPRHGERSWGLTDFPDRLEFVQFWAQRSDVGVSPVFGA